MSSFASNVKEINKILKVTAIRFLDRGFKVNVKKDLEDEGDDEECAADEDECDDKKLVPMQLLTARLREGSVVLRRVHAGPAEGGWT